MAQQADENLIIAREIAAALGESDDKPINQIVQIIELCGVEFARNTLTKTQETEASGGMKTHDGKRRRTPGGVFFFLAKGNMEPELRQQIFPDFGQSSKSAKDILPPGIDWEERIEPMQSLRDTPGTLQNVTITLVGRPDKVEVHQSSVMMVLEQTELRTPPYAKGVPTAPIEPPVYYTVYVGLKQWMRVADALENPKDLLMIEGTPTYDAATESIGVSATHVTTKWLRKKDQRSAAKSGKDSAKTTQTASKVPSQEVVVPENAPADAVDKLKQLTSAADTLRQKIARMEESGNDAGIGMTKRLLDNTEKQIAALQRKYAD